MNSANNNRSVYGRYLAASQARCGIVYTQDDDCIVKNIDVLLDQFDNRYLISSVKDHARSRYETARYGVAQVALLGWGSVFMRDWIAVLNKYLQAFGEDILLHREADRIFTLLLNQPHRYIPACVDDFECAKDSNALWRDPKHWEYYMAAVSRSLSLLD